MHSDKGQMDGEGSNKQLRVRFKLSSSILIDLICSTLGNRQITHTDRISLIFFYCPSFAALFEGRKEQQIDRWTDTGGDRNISSQSAPGGGGGWCIWPSMVHMLFMCPRPIPEALSWPFPPSFPAHQMQRCATCKYGNLATDPPSSTLFCLLQHQKWQKYNDQMHVFVTCFLFLVLTFVEVLLVFLVSRCSCFGYMWTGNDAWSKGHGKINLIAWLGIDDRKE
jgi:hypothetical protein